MTWKSPNGQLLYRVGDVMISTNPENPSTFFGGTWQLLCPGRTLVCVDTSDSDFNTVKKTGGSKYLQSHNHSGSIASSGNHSHSIAISNAGSHRHIFYKGNGDGTSGSYIANDKVPVVANNGNNIKLVDYTGKYMNGSYSMSVSGEHSHSSSVTTGGAHNHSLTVNANGSGNAQNLQPFMAVYMWVRIA